MESRVSVFDYIYRNAAISELSARITNGFPAELQRNVSYQHAPYKVVARFSSAKVNKVTRKEPNGPGEVLILIVQASTLTVIEMYIHGNNANASCLPIRRTHDETAKQTLGERMVVSHIHSLECDPAVS